MARILCAGLATVDLLYTVDRIPAVDEKAQATSVEVAAGGPAANAAITAALLGAEVTLVSAVGEHPLGGGEAPIIPIDWLEQIQPDIHVAR